VSEHAIAGRYHENEIESNEPVFTVPRYGVGGERN
jgi:hypothetical protein